MPELELKPELLRKVPFFKSLEDRDLVNIIMASENGIEEYGHRDVIVREAENAECMYVVLDGHLEITVRGAPPVREIVVATLKPGDFFGEQALMPESSGKRNANVRVLRRSKVFRIDKKHVLLHIEDNTEKKGSSTGENIKLENSDSFSIGLEPNEVRDLIMNIGFFRNLTSKELKAIHSWTRTVTFNPGDIIIKKFDEGRSLYIILQGSVEIYTLNAEDKEVVLANLGKGKMFGEQALMPNSTGKSNAFVRASETSKMIKIGKKHFRAILARNTKLHNAS